VIFKKSLLLPKKIAQYFVGRQMSTQFVLQKLYEVCSFLSEMYHIPYFTITNNYGSCKL